VKILGIGFLLFGAFSIIYYKQSAKSYAEFQKGWGLTERTALIVGRVIAVLGGLMLVGAGVLMIIK